MNYSYDFKEGCVGCIIALILIVLFSLLGAFIFMSLWNWITPEFWSNCPILNIWQAWGFTFMLGMIGRLLFGNRKSE